jgi:hypothetical protein
MSPIEKRTMNNIDPKFLLPPEDRIAGTEIPFVALAAFDLPGLAITE